MSMLKQLGIDYKVVCVTSDTAADMKNEVVEHHTSDHIVWLRCGCHKTERTVQKLVLQSEVNVSLTVFSKAVARLHKSAHTQEAFEREQRALSLHFARC